MWYDYKKVTDGNNRPGNGNNQPLGGLFMETQR